MSGAPVLLFSNGDGDAEFFYACRFDVERAAYLGFAPGDDLLIVRDMELERARAESSARRVVLAEELGYTLGAREEAAWAKAVAGALGERSMRQVRVSPNMRIAYQEGLAEAGVEVAEIDHALFTAERRRKSPEEGSFIHAAQRAAEAACVEVISRIGAAEAREGLLWDGGRPLTSERLKAEAERVLTEIGYAAGEMIVAGPPQSAQPHNGGTGQIRAGGPIVIDIFPRGRTSRYCGDLTRTVVAGEPPPEVGRMHAAVCAALDAGAALLREGANGRDVHRAACRVLVEAGFGTNTAGLEGAPGGARMIHSLGHGVGLQVHEEPGLRDLDVTLRAGDVVTVEPGLYLANLGGVRVEDTGMVTQEGFKNYSSISRSLDPRAYM
ncbi:MAG: M24 family metallopeptidase [Candidatus Dormibacterales bacterium]